MTLIARSIRGKLEILDITNMANRWLSSYVWSSTIDYVWHQSSPLCRKNQKLNGKIQASCQRLEEYKQNVVLTC